MSTCLSINELVYGLNETVSAPGSLGIGLVKDEGKIRFIITNAGPANVVRVRARVSGQPTWITITDLLGNANELVDVYGYDQIEVICLVYSSTSSVGFNIYASSFNGAAVFFNTDNGSLQGNTEINFISSDGSVDISANEINGTIDFIVTPTGTGNTKYSLDFLSSDFVLGAGQYELTVLASVHNKGTTPIVQVVEDNLGEFSLVSTLHDIAANGDVTIIVSETPDNRFNGKIIIS